MFSLLLSLLARRLAGWLALLGAAWFCLVLSVVREPVAAAAASAAVYTCCSPSSTCCEGDSLGLVFV